MVIKDHLSESPDKLAADPLEDAHEQMNEKEISALCWASSAGSMLAVGYVDGDILLWNIPRGAFSKSKNAGVPCNDVVKLQLSSAEKRLPVIYLCWGESTTSQSSCGGQLFIYGGCEIGSEEVLTVGYSNYYFSTFGDLPCLYGDIFDHLLNLFVVESAFLSRCCNDL